MTRTPGIGGRVVSLVCGAVAVVVALFAQWASRWPELHLSQLLHVADTDPIADLIRGLDPDFRFVTGVEHYDGVYYYAIALDPFATGQAHDLIDLAGYRYGSPLWGWLGGLFSFGNPVALPLVFWLMGLASIFGAAYLLSRLVASGGGSAWWGLAVAASPGMLYSSTTLLTEPLQLAMVCAVLLWWARGDRANPWVLAALVVLTCLLKQQLVLVPVALLLHAGHLMLRGRRTGLVRVLALAAGPAAYLAWASFIRTRFSPEQLTYDDGNIGLPFLGWLQTFEFASHLRVGDPYSMQIGTTAPAGITATAVILVAGAAAGLYRRDALGFVVVLQAALVTCLGWLTLLHPHELFRIPSVPVALALASVAIGLRRGGIVAAAAAPSEESSTVPTASDEGYVPRHARRR